MPQDVRQAGLAVLDALLPRGCGGCGAAGPSWCARCTALVQAGGALSVIASIRTPPHGLPDVHVTGPYQGPLRAGLLAYKERGRRDLAPVLGAALAVAVEGARRSVPRQQSLVVVPVPASPAGLRGRGFDHVTTLLRAAPSIPLPQPLLHWRRQVADQARLDRAHRVANLAFALDIRPGVVKRWPPHAGIVLVDDVVTTGATLGEAVRACLRAGLDVAGAAALLATRTVPDTSGKQAIR